MTEMDTSVQPITNLVEGLSADERAEINDLALRCFGPPELRQPHRLAIASNEDTRFIVRVWNDRLLVACLWINDRDILVGDCPTHMAGIRGVRTDPAFRLRGFASAAMRKAAEFIWNDVKPDIAMLHSSVMAVRLYQGLGWTIINGPVFCDQPAGKINVTEELLENPIMVQMPPGKEPPSGIVDLCGLPF